VPEPEAVPADTSVVEGRIPDGSCTMLCL
jgi:hypothetical protein